jgi:hypothetical protein
MNTKMKLALAAVLFSAIASPSFAGDQDLAALQASSGRITGTPFAMPGNAYASATKSSAHHRFMVAQNWSTDMALSDRLAQGHT